MSTIQPKFNISPITGTPQIGSGQHHTSTPALSNLLMPVLFNEYERVMSLLAEAVGDTDYETILSGPFGSYFGVPLYPSSFPKTIGESFEIIAELIGVLYATKLSLSGGTVIGSITATDTITSDKVVTHDTIIMWEPNHQYSVSSLVLYNNNIYIARQSHTSSSEFTTDINYWIFLSERGGNTRILTLPDGYSETFNVGNVIRYNNGYTKAKADSLDTLGVYVIVEKINDRTYIVSSDGFVTFSEPILSTLNHVYYLSSSEAGEITTIRPPISQEILVALSSTTAIITLHNHREGSYLVVDSFGVTDNGQTEFELSFTPLMKQLMMVSHNGLLLPPYLYHLSGSTLVLDFDDAIVGDEIVCRYFYGNEFTSFDVIIDGYDVGNNIGDAALSNGIVCQTLNADLLDGLHKEGYVTTDGNVTIYDTKVFKKPIGIDLDEAIAPFVINENGNQTVANLNADMTDSYHATIDPISNTIVVRNEDNIAISDQFHSTITASGKPPLIIESQVKVDNLNADMVDGVHVSKNPTLNTIPKSDSVEGKLVDGWIYGQVPVGGIIMYGGGNTTDPAPSISDFLYCDGSAISRTTFATLFNKIGTTFGVGNGSTTFNIPNFKAVVPRGMGTQAINGHTKDGSNLGTKLEDRIQQMTGYFTADDFGLTAYGGVFGSYGVKDDQPEASSSKSNNGVSFDASRVARTGDYTRDNSLSVRFYIRYK